MLARATLNPRLATGRSRSLIAAAALLAAVPGAAHATTTVSRSGNTITMTGDAAGDHVTGAGDHANRYVTFFGPTDDVLRAGAGCRFLPGHDHGGHRELACGRIARPANPLTLKANLGAGDDQLVLAWRSDRQPRAIVDAGDGNDEVDGTILADELAGGAGDDKLLGFEDVDQIDGGDGSDEVFGGDDSDVVRGGPGIDKIYGDAVPGTPDTFFGFSGGDILDATDFPADISGLSPEQVLAYAPQPDVVACGPGGDDAATVDAADAVDPSCEIRTGANPTPPADHTQQFPYEQVVGTRERYRLNDLLRGEPLRFTVVPSATALIDANVQVSASTARRLGLGRGRNARFIAAIRPVLVQAKQTGELFLRLDWPDRPHLHGTIQAKLTVRAAVQAATSGPSTVTSVRDITLRP